jgi:hypothetical protein
VELAVDILVAVPLVDLVDNSPEVEVRSLKKERAQATTHIKSQKLCTKNPEDLLPFSPRIGQQSQLETATEVKNH